MSLRTFTALIVLVLSTGCPRRPPPPEMRAPRIPSGCEVNLSGEYRFKGREDWRYLADDDGGTLVLHPVRTLADGGLGPERPDGGTLILLERTPDGFVGAAHAVAWPSRSLACAVSFPTEVTACRGEALLLKTADAVAVDEACRAAPTTPPPGREVELLRGPADGGS